MHPRLQKSKMGLKICTFWKYTLNIVTYTEYMKNNRMMFFHIVVKCKIETNSKNIYIPTNTELNFIYFLAFLHKRTPGTC